jgi:hypothetical protein
MGLQVGSKVRYTWIPGLNVIAIVAISDGPPSNDSGRDLHCLRRARLCPLRAHHNRWLLYNKWTKIVILAGRSHDLEIFRSLARFTETKFKAPFGGPIIIPPLLKPHLAPAFSGTVTATFSQGTRHSSSSSWSGSVSPRFYSQTFSSHLPPDYLHHLYISHICLHRCTYTFNEMIDHYTLIISRPNMCFN